MLDILYMTFYVIKVLKRLILGEPVMKRFLSLWIGCALLGACSHTTEVCGTYTGVLPAADGPGIETTITFFQNGAFTERQLYLDSDTAPFVTRGVFYRENDMIVATSPSAPTFYYAIEENAIRQLDFNRSIIKGPLSNNYVLKQVDSCH